MKRKKGTMRALGKALKQVTETLEYKKRYKAQLRHKIKTSKEGQHTLKLSIGDKTFIKIYFGKEPFAELSDLEIEKSKRRIRIGETLLEEAEKLAKEKGYGWIELNAQTRYYEPHPYEFYEKQGYIPHPSKYTLEQGRKRAQQNSMVRLVKPINLVERDWNALVRFWEKTRKKREQIDK